MIFKMVFNSVVVALPAAALLIPPSTPFAIGRLTYEPCGTPDLAVDSLFWKTIESVKRHESAIDKRWHDRIEVTVHFHAILPEQTPPMRGSVRQMRPSTGL